MADPVVELTSGSIRGVVEHHEDGFNYYAFKGIPYGEPPIGELRFQDSIPKSKWTGVLDCKSYCPISFQSDLFTGEEYYDEEHVLNVNVYTHAIDQPNAGIPVIVYLHTGEYNTSSATDEYAGPDYLIRKNIVLVTPHFRLGVLGFLDTEDEVAPGNQGLKDIVLALRWVQENIRMFAGDPDNVTIFGMSSGSASAHYLALSPLAKGLMHKVICNNVSANAPWVCHNNSRENAFKICSLLGKDLVDSKDVVDFLRTVDTKALLHAQQKVRAITNNIPFGPGVDSKSSNPFMPVSRHIAADQGIHLPLLTGFNARSGLIVLFDNLTFTGISREKFFEMGDSDMENMLLFNGKEVLERHGLTVKQLRKLYYKSERVSVDNLEKYVDLMTDIYFAESIEKMARIQAERSSAPTYLYRFSYDSPNAISKILLKNTPTGACVLDEWPLFFKLGFYSKVGVEQLKKGTRDYRLMEQLTEMWTNFATYGRPTIGTSELIPVDWKPIADGTLLRYLNIDEDLTMQYSINVDQKFLSARDITV